MTDRPDTELLEEFVRDNSEAAFASLAQRHLSLVYSSALRQTGNPSAAEEVAQAVFIVLARKASTLRRGTILPGWLYHTTRLTAANWRRAEARRARREREAVMQSIVHQSPPDHAWRELSVLLDDAMAQLGATDRDALVLRYFQNKTLPEVGHALGMEERAAQKRVTRAIEKLRKILSRRGVVLTATLIAGAISANSVQAAPAGLAASVAAAGAKSALASTTLTALANGTVKTIAWLKIKFALAIGAPALVVGSAATIAVLAVQPSRSTEQLPQLTTNSPIILHLQNPPWIKHVRFKRGDLLMAGATPARIERTQWTDIEYSAGLQPGGYFCEKLSPDLPGFGPGWVPGERRMTGMSESSAWAVHWQGDLPNQMRRLIHSSRLPGEGGSPDDVIQFGSMLMKRMLVERVRLFGLPPLRENSFKFGDHSKFEALTDTGEAVEGRYGDITNDRPYTLAFSVNTSDGLRSFVVKYDYATAEEPLPNRFDLSEVTRNIHKQIPNTTTNRIEEVDYGIDPKITDGYHPSTFFPNLNQINENITYSNKTQYRWTASDRTARKIIAPTQAEADADQRRLSTLLAQQAKSGAEQRGLVPERRRLVMLYWLAGLIVSAAVVWVVARKIIRNRS